MKKRALSLFMAFCILLSSMVFSPIISAADTLVHTDHDGMFGAHLLSRTEITKKGDGSFDVTVDMYTYYAVLKGNTNVTSSTDDYYVVDRDGKYLVELWGGDGASTGTAKGGLGGYTYGMIDLKVGDVLYYTLGGAGSVSAETGKGGGANGGGGAGDKGSTAVGGGGGYSALYLYENGPEADRFYENYTDGDKILTGELREADRTSKYIMIAGGGGGAGAGGGDNRGSANGGDGGHYGTASGVLEGSGYAVVGNFYAGMNGSSTDGTGDYAGKGGSYIPGRVVSTMWGWGEGGQPNDWVGAQNKNLEGGAGGTGNYRGGGGGGGFAGGSGGVVSNIALALGVGGGGGGSSFVKGSTFTTELTDAAEGYQVGRERTERREGDEDGVLGGLFHIVYLDESNVDYLSNLSVEFARTPFFNITAFSAVNTVNGVPKTYEFIENDTEEERESKINIDYVSYSLEDNSFSEIDENTPVGSISTLKFKIPQVSLMPNRDTGENRDHLTIKLTFTPKADFAGGNNVPLFAGSEIVARPADRNEHSGHISGEVSMRSFCGYVNVPLKLNPAPVNHTPRGLDPEKMVHKVSSLYVDRYADVRNSLEGHWQYYFLESIGAHTVTDEFGADVPLLKQDGTDNTVSPDETTRYFVSLAATAKAPRGTNFARLGDPVTSQTFTGVSVITIAGSGMDALGDNMLVYNKTLSYDGENYVLGLHVSSDSSGSIADESSKPKFNSVQYGGETDANGQTVSRISTVQIPIDGFYTITLKGGNGGTGGGASFSLLGATGGKGGVGGNISATFSLSAGTRLMFYAGKNADSQSLTNKGAAGGAPSYVAVLDGNGNIDYYLMIAAGGPGGGGAGALWSDGTNGTQPKQIDVSDKKLTTEAELNAYTGAAGKDGGWSGSGSAGSAGTSYIYQASSDGVEYKADSAQSLDAPEGTPAGGGASLTCDALGTGVKGDEAQLGKYKLETAISKYFTVKNVSIEMVAGTDPILSQKTATYVDQETETTGDNYTYSLVTTNITATPVPLKEGSEVKHVEFTLKIELTPREGFLGGNDVKVIEPAKDTTGLLTGMKLSLSDSTDYIDIDESRTLDYANVAIDESLKKSIALETQNKTYVYGDALYVKDLVKSVALPDLSVYGWKADYLKLIDPSKDETLLTPSETKNYTIVAGIGPLHEDPYATVCSPEEVVSITKEGTATVYTDFQVIFELKHIQHDVSPDASGRFLIPFGPDGAGGYVALEDYVFNLQTTVGEAGHNHHLPKAIIVKVGDRVLEEGVDYKYDRGYDVGASATGGAGTSTQATVTIYKDKINGNVTVTAAACEEHHTLYYVYQTAPDSEATTTLAIPEKHYSEHVLPEEDFAAVGATLPEEYEHYTFEWSYGELAVDPEGHHVMPKGEAWVTGRYVPKEYTVTVQYVYADGTKAAEPYTGSYTYGSDYSIVSPTINSFVPNTATVSGTVDGNVEITVTYTSAEGLLTVYYLYADGTEAAEPYTQILTSGDAFSVDSPSIKGYTADAQTVSGNMDDDGHTVTVTYTANRYTVTFKVDGEVLETRVVEYNNSYSYDPEKGTYNAFPTAIKLGYTFEGWTRNGVSVNAGDTVYITSDTVLEAKFKSLIFSVTVHYVTDLGATAYQSVTDSFEMGEAYRYETPSYKGHTPDKDLIEGTVAAQNLVVTVTYYRNTYTVTVHYEVPAGAEQPESYTAELLHGESYSVPSPEIEGYQPNIALVEDVVNAANVTFTVTYYSTAITVDVSWGDMTFTYDLGEWDPETHTYSGGSFTVSNNSNTVTVTNQTVGKDVDVTFDFMPLASYTGVTGYFSSDEGGASKVTAEIEVAADGGSATVYFRLEDNEALGSIALPDQFVAGHCTVTIREKQEVS